LWVNFSVFIFAAVNKQTTKPDLRNTVSITLKTLEFCFPFFPIHAGTTTFQKESIWVLSKQVIPLSVA